MGFPRRSTPRRWHGIGHPTTVEALTRLDVEIQRIQDGLADAGLLDITNIWVASDHGFSQHTGSVDLGALLTPFADTLDDGSPRIVAGAGAIYVRDDDQTTVAEIVAAFQQADGVGAVFTRAAAAGPAAAVAGSPRRAATSSAGHRQPAGLAISTAAKPAPSTKLAKLNVSAFRMLPLQCSVTRRPTARSRSPSAINESDT